MKAVKLSSIHTGRLCLPGNCLGRLRLKCDGTRTETIFRLSVKRTSQFKSARSSQFGRLLVAEVSASAVVMLDIPYSEVVLRALATQSIGQFPLHFPTLRHRVPSHFNWTLLIFVTGRFDPRTTVWSKGVYN